MNLLQLFQLPLLDLLNVGVLNFQVLHLFLRQGALVRNSVARLGTLYPVLGGLHVKKRCHAAYTHVVQRRHAQIAGCVQQGPDGDCVVFPDEGVVEGAEVVLQPVRSNGLFDLRWLVIMPLAEGNDQLELFGQHLLEDDGLVEAIFSALELYQRREVCYPRIRTNREPVH